MKSLLLASTLVAACFNVPVDETGQHTFRVNTRLLATSETSLSWADPEQLIQQGVKFIDKTDHLEMYQNAPETTKLLSKYSLPSIKNKEKVKKLFDSIDLDRMEERLTTFTGFKNRYFRSKSGVESAQWLKSTIVSVIEANGVNATVDTFSHSWNQPSLIVRIAGVVDGPDAPFIIVGSHQDTVKGGWITEGRAPGADDDGSGSMTTLEAFTVLCESGFAPEIPVEFHWYSAEEMGLLGSQDVAHKYQKEGKNMVAMIQFDMTGYGKHHVIGIVEDYVNEDLTKTLKELVDNYSSLKYKATKCNYGCSDHASWYGAGFRSAFPFEGEFKDSSPYIHGKDDTVDHIDFEHMKEFVKIAISFASELSVNEY